MKGLKKFFTDKRFIYGSGSVATFAGFVAVVILLNLIVGTLSDKFTLKIDLTENKIFELSEQTIEIAKSIDKPVDIIVVQSATSQEDTQTRELLTRYVNLNKNFRLSTVDPVKNPMSVQKYNTLNSNITNGSIILDNGEKFRIVPSSELRSYSSYTGQNDQFQAEYKITSALLSLSKASDMAVAFTQGHGEATLNAAEQALKDDNIAVEKVHTLSEGFSDEYNMFIIVSPKTDFTPEEIDYLDNYLRSGKSIQIYFDVDTPHLPKLEGYLYDNGIVVERNAVYEGDTTRVLSNTPYCFVPDVKPHSITNAIVSNKINVVTYLSRSIKPLWEEKNLVKIEPLLTSTAKSVAFSAENPNDVAQGPLNLAVVATKTYENSKETSKIFVMGSSLFLSEQFLPMNEDFFLSSVNWQIDNTNVVNIRPKSVLSSRLDIKQQDYDIWRLVFIIFIPVLVLVWGLVTWIRRRHL
ncbi:MAG: Gldg family protein [Eubacteriales bacterium]|nr:Gldg family protein [Eubacteriales bacterium]